MASNTVVMPQAASASCGCSALRSGKYTWGAACGAPGCRCAPRRGRAPAGRRPGLRPGVLLGGRRSRRSGHRARARCRRRGPVAEHDAGIGEEAFSHGSIKVDAAGPATASRTSVMKDAHHGCASGLGLTDQLTTMRRLAASSEAVGLIKQQQRAGSTKPRAMLTRCCCRPRRWPGQAPQALGQVEGQQHARGVSRGLEGGEVGAVVQRSAPSITGAGWASSLRSATTSSAAWRGSAQELADAGNARGGAWPPRSAVRRYCLQAFTLTALQPQRALSGPHSCRTGTISVDLPRPRGRPAHTLARRHLQAHTLQHRQPQPAAQVQGEVLWTSCTSSTESVKVTPCRMSVACFKAERRAAPPARQATRLNAASGLSPRGPAGRPAFSEADRTRGPVHVSADATRSCV